MPFLCNYFKRSEINKKVRPFLYPILIFFQKKIVGVFLKTLEHKRQLWVNIWQNALYKQVLEFYFEHKATVKIPPPLCSICFIEMKEWFQINLKFKKQK